MSDGAQRRATSRWPWVVAIAVIVASNVLLLGSQSGQCIDYTAESEVESTCTVGPALGVPAMWGVAILSIVAIAYFAYRIAQGSRRSI